MRIWQNNTFTSSIAILSRVLEPGNVVFRKQWRPLTHSLHFPLPHFSLFKCSLFRHLQFPSRSLVRISHVMFPCYPAIVEGVQCVLYELHTMKRGSEQGRGNTRLLILTSSGLPVLILHGLSLLGREREKDAFHSCFLLSPCSFSICFLFSECMECACYGPGACHHRHICEESQNQGGTAAGEEGLGRTTMLVWTSEGFLCMCCACTARKKGTNKNAKVDPRVFQGP